MGARKKISAEKRKEALKTMYFAKLQNVPTSPRKMRLVADMIRGMEVNRALGVLKFSSKEAAARVEKLLRSAIANWEQKNERKAESGELFVTKIFVDGGATLKRMRPAPQGRGYRIRKRSNHNPQRIQRLLNTLFYLESHTFLHLQAVRENIHYAGYLAQSGNVAVRNICHMCLSVEGKHVMFAKREEINVFHNHHLTVFFLKLG